MKRTVPLSNLKNTTGIVNYCKECKVPIFITRNGTAEMVIMNTEVYNRYRENALKDLKENQKNA